MYIRSSFCSRQEYAQHRYLSIQYQGSLFQHMLQQNLFFLNIPHVEKYLGYKIALLQKTRLLKYCH